MSNEKPNSSDVSLDPLSLNILNSLRSLISLRYGDCDFSNSDLVNIVMCCVDLDLVVDFLSDGYSEDFYE